MSELYTPNMDIPKSCGSCPYDESSCYCSKTKSRIDRDYEHIERLSDCPLVVVKTPHGRMIDADELVDILLNSSECTTVFDVIRKVKGASTIIPAEEVKT